MDGHIQLVACLVQDEEYAIEIDVVQEITRYTDITRVPHSSPFISGVINLRGMVIPVMDLRKRFGMPSQAPDESTRIVVIKWKGAVAGIIVDAVSEVIRVPLDNIEPAPSHSTKINSKFFSGIGKLGARLMVILNLERILDIHSETC